MLDGIDRIAIGAVSVFHDDLKDYCYQ